MAKKLLITLGAIILVGLTGAATYLTLGALIPKEQPVDDTAKVVKPDTTATDTGTIDQTDDTPITTARDDTTVKNMLDIISSHITTYQSNNRGALPQTNDTLTSFSKLYLTDVDLTNPISKNTYTLNLTELRDDTIFFQPGYVCNETATAGKVGASRRFALTVTLPSGKQYCTGV